MCAASVHVNTVKATKELMNSSRMHYKTRPAFGLDGGLALNRRQAIVLMLDYWEQI